MALPGWGTVAGKIAEWFPGKKESKENNIAKLLRENAQLQRESPLTVATAARIESNAARIKQLREELSRIA